ncbi:MAG: RHS repeat-associated core domain-containing protein [Caulobacter sp.]
MRLELLSCRCEHGLQIRPLVHDVAGAVYDQTFGFGFTWSPASQLLTRTASNAAYKWATPTPGTTANAYDGLNRDSAIVTAGGYDPRGNLTADGSRTFTYDVENRMLTAVSGGTTVMFAYDPIGRLTTTATPASTTFLYDSDRLSAEYSAVGAVLRRYVHGPGMDEPLVWYEGAGTTDRRWLHQDRQGSVIAWSNGSGTVSASTIYKYGPWGEPGDAWGAGSRFRYTGQIAIPEARLYHYKARMYDPATGRFMQTTREARPRHCVVAATSSARRGEKESQDNQPLAKTGLARFLSCKNKWLTGRVSGAHCALVPSGMPSPWLRGSGRGVT